MWDYTKKVMDHFLNPRNVGEIENPDAVAEVGNISCGDALKLFIKLDANGRISDVKFKTFGCASAIASSSALTELVKGMTLDEAEKVTNQDIVKVLGELPEEKMHCSVMGMEALQAAIQNYRKGVKDATPFDRDEDHEGRIVCHCFGVTDVKIRKVALENNLRTVEQITSYTKAGGGCGCCLDDIQEILDGLWKNAPAVAAPAVKDPTGFSGLSLVQKILKIQDVIDKEIRPLLERDGGSIELVDVKDNKVIVRLKGRCAVCPTSKITLKNTVQGKLREFVSPVLEVEDSAG